MISGLHAILVKCVGIRPGQSPPEECSCCHGMTVVVTKSSLGCSGRYSQGSVAEDLDASSNLCCKQPSRIRVRQFGRL